MRYMKISGSRKPCKWVIHFFPKALEDFLSFPDPRNISLNTFKIPLWELIINIRTWFSLQNYPYGTTMVALQANLLELILIYICTPFPFSVIHSVWVTINWYCVTCTTTPRNQSVSILHFTWKRSRSQQSSWNKNFSDHCQYFYRMPKIRSISLK